MIVNQLRRLRSRTRNAYWKVASAAAERGVGLTDDHQALRHLRNCHAGRRAFLLGNGPSVRTEDLDRLQDEVTFCCNRFHLAYGRTKLRPNYTISGDRQMIQDFGQEIVSESAGIVFLAYADRRPRLKGDYVWLRFSYDVSV